MRPISAAARRARWRYSRQNDRLPFPISRRPPRPACRASSPFVVWLVGAIRHRCRHHRPDAGRGREGVRLGRPEEGLGRSGAATGRRADRALRRLREGRDRQMGQGRSRREHQDRGAGLRATEPFRSPSDRRASGSFHAVDRMPVFRAHAPLVAAPLALHFRKFREETNMGDSISSCAAATLPMAPVRQSAKPTSR